MTCQIRALLADRDPWVAEVTAKRQSKYSSHSPYSRSPENARAEDSMFCVGIQTCYEPRDRAFGTTQGENEKDVTGVPGLHEYTEVRISLWKGGMAYLLNSRKLGRI
jgi:hypothetical protein